MASHILDEVEKICSHVAILKNGNLLASGSIGSILSNAQFAEINAENQDQLVSWIEQQPYIVLIKRDNKIIECSLDDTITAAQLNINLQNDGIALTHLVVRPRKLEEEFISITS
ncbi:MAG TPA: hypothetical protein PKD85_20290, partial [Saprospiraceae bacterium]|nr:hypothetical protein [Saprospiraceae bacterium]